MHIDEVMEFMLYLLVALKIEVPYILNFGSLRKARQQRPETVCGIFRNRIQSMNGLVAKFENAAFRGSIQ